MAISEIVGVYDADGGLLGEAAYVWGKVRGTRHCGLCDITHSLLRRRPAWDAMASRLGVPVRLAHRNEVADAERSAWAPVGLPVVLGLTADGRHQVLLGDERRRRPIIEDARRRL